MTYLDAYALVAFLIGGPAAAAVRGLLRDGNTAVATANLAEALDVSRRVYGFPIERAKEVIEPLFDQALRAVSLDMEVAYRAASIRMRYYHRSTCPISLADAVLLGSGAPGDRIATSDPHVLSVAGQEGFEPVELPGQG